MLNSGNVISPQFPILIMIDIIYNEYIYLNRREQLAMHSDTLRALKSTEHYMLNGTGKYNRKNYFAIL